MLAPTSILLLAHVASALLGPTKHVCGRRAVLFGAGSALVSWQPSPSFARDGDKGMSPEERASIIERAKRDVLTTERAIDRAKAGAMFDGLPRDVDCNSVVKIMNSMRRPCPCPSLSLPRVTRSQMPPLSVDKKAIEEESYLIKELRSELKAAKGDEESRERLKKKINEVRTIEVRLDQAVTDLQYDEVIKACLEEALAAQSAAF